MDCGAAREPMGHNGDVAASVLAMNDFATQKGVEQCYKRGGPDNGGGLDDRRILSLSLGYLEGLSASIRHTALSPL